MKLYRVCWQSMDGSFIGWHTSKAAAKRRVREVKGNDSDAICFEISVEDVPTKRAELAGWLDRNYNSLNG